MIKLMVVEAIKLICVSWMLKGMITVVQLKSIEETAYKYSATYPVIRKVF